MTVEGRVQQKGAVQMGKSGPYSAMGDLREHSVTVRHDPTSKLAQIAAKAQNNPKGNLII